MVEVYRNKQYSIFGSDDCYVVVNENMEDFAHTHINRLDSAKWLIELSLSKKCPYDIPKYFIISLIRINNDEKYLEKLESILECKYKTRKNKYYYNSNKGIR